MGLDPPWVSLLSPPATTPTTCPDKPRDEWSHEDWTSPPLGENTPEEGIGWDPRRGDGHNQEGTEENDDEIASHKSTKAKLHVWMEERIVDT